MNLIKRLFGKKDIYFEIVESVITNPEGWTKEIQPLVYSLTEKEKDTLLKICKILQKHLEHHFIFWTRTAYTKAKLKEDYTILFKSYFELLMIDWVLITHSFKKKNIRVEVGQTLWWVINYSLNAYSNILFSKENFKNYEDAFNDRNKLYPQIFTNYFGDDTNKINVAQQNLFNLVIADPLTKDTINHFESFYSVIYGVRVLDYDFDKNMSQLFVFTSYFTKEIRNFSDQINDTLRQK